jgi:hypothetical protein
MQALQLALRAIEGIAQGKIDILVSRTVDMKTVGMDLRAGHGEVNPDPVAGSALVAIARAFERHVTPRDPLTESCQPRTERACPILQRA